MRGGVIGRATPSSCVLVIVWYAWMAFDIPLYVIQSQWGIYFKLDFKNDFNLPERFSSISRWEQFNLLGRSISSSLGNWFQAPREIKVQLPGDWFNLLGILVSSSLRYWFQAPWEIEFKLLWKKEKSFFFVIGGLLCVGFFGRPVQSQGILYKHRCDSLIMRLADPFPPMASSHKIDYVTQF